MMNNPEDDEEISPSTYDLAAVGDVMSRKFEIYKEGSISIEDDEDFEILAGYKNEKKQRYYYGYDEGAGHYIHKMSTVEPDKMVEVSACHFYENESKETCLVERAEEVEYYEFCLIEDDYIIRGTIAMTNPFEAESFYQALRSSVESLGAKAALGELLKRYGKLKTAERKPFLTYQEEKRYPLKKDQ